MTCGVCGDPAVCRDHGCQAEAEEAAYWEQMRPEPTAEDYCESYGHPYHSDEYDWRGVPPESRQEARMMAGRCYCGAARYPAGGPKAVELVHVSERYL